MANRDDQALPLMPGTHLAHYIIMRHLARGGMGDVYQAYEAALGRHVAIKVLRDDMAADEEFKRLFNSEAKSLASIRHPNIIPIYYIGEEKGLLFFSMSYIQGKSLAAWIDVKRRFNFRRAAWFMSQAVSALSAALRENIIHLDIKPENFLVDNTNTILLTDFGLAQQAGSISSSGDEMLIGTPYYISPEQIQGDATDCRTDIYSLGATLHHLMTGKPLFQGDKLDDLLVQHLKTPYPEDFAEAMGVPEEWIQILKKMTRTRPQDRYRDYDELIEDLKHLEGWSEAKELNLLDEEPSEDDELDDLDPLVEKTKVILAPEKKKTGGAVSQLGQPVAAAYQQEGEDTPHQFRMGGEDKRKKILYPRYFQRACELAQDTVRDLAIPSTLVVFMVTDEKMTPQEKLENGVLNVMRSGDLVGELGLPFPNIAALLLSTPQAGAEIFEKRVNDHCATLGDWSKELYVMRFNIDHDTSFKSIREFILDKIG